ncbi:jg7917 [Pararge aegeria aegeria]|uniref:Jg7917 protein n=1 Tax=Pararge aegeria aegeria TaxID=348720 RepID=A0A8S4R2W5_9NEOP|nr:jg7917 [Pararge aegeria aegeria]
MGTAELLSVQNLFICPSHDPKWKLSRNTVRGKNVLVKETVEEYLASSSLGEICFCNIIIISPLLAHYRARVSSQNDQGIGRSLLRWPSADWWTSHAINNDTQDSQACRFPHDVFLHPLKQVIHITPKN